MGLILFLKPKFKKQLAHIKIMDLVITYILALIITKKINAFVPKIVIFFFTKTQHIAIYINIAQVEIFFYYLAQKDFGGAYYLTFIKINYLLTQNYIRQNFN